MAIPGKAQIQDPTERWSPRIALPLGAGLDTFAYRNPYEDRALRVFEVDHPATQAWKRESVATAGLTVPASLTYAPIDFETESLELGLARAGFRFDAPALFSWLGVVPYLTLPAITTTWRFLAGLAPGTAVIFDYAEPPETLALPQRLLFQAAANRVAALGEPWITFFIPEDLDKRLRESGFSDIQDLSAQDINRLYFADRQDKLRVSPPGRLAKASVPRAS